MAQQTINTGSTANDGTGDPLRTAFIKTNANFTEVYSLANGKVSQSYVDSNFLKNDGTSLLDGMTLGHGAGGQSTNTALGQYALDSNLGGNSNTAVGFGALRNANASGNTAFGTNALQNATGGSRNTAVGVAAMSSNLNGNRNIGIGYSSLSSNQTGSFNTAVGYDSLLSSTTSSYNTAFGYYALRANTSGNSNVAVGSSSLSGTTSGSYNTAVGLDSMKNSTTANRNVAIGYNAMLSNASGDDNTAVGVSALQGISNGTFNTAIGKFALRNVNSGDRNTAIGASAGNNTTLGNNNTSVGYNAKPASISSSNQITLGDANVIALRCNVQTITSISDGRDKDNIEQIPLGLDYVNALKPVKFDWNRRDGSLVGKTDIGFIAQDLKQLEEDFEAGYLETVFDENPEMLEASYGRLLPVIVRSIQELSNKIELIESSN